MYILNKYDKKKIVEIKIQVLLLLYYKYLFTLLNIKKKKNNHHYNIIKFITYTYKCTYNGALKHICTTYVGIYRYHNNGVPLYQFKQHK